MSDDDERDRTLSRTITEREKEKQHFRVECERVDWKRKLRAEEEKRTENEKDPVSTTWTSADTSRRQSFKTMMM
eukprot:567412-Rhodomonas_salina.2